MEACSEASGVRFSEAGQLVSETAQRKRAAGEGHSCRTGKDMAAAVEAAVC